MGYGVPPVFGGTLILDGERPRRVKGKRMETETDLLGRELAAKLEWDSRIIDACIAALEDANFHAWAELLDAVKDFEPAQVRELITKA